MGEWSEAHVAANGLKVFYQRSGPDSNKPPILLLHGYTDNGRCWSRVAHDLTAMYDVIMPDARGHGHTQGAVGDMAIDLLAADTAAVIQALGLQRPFLFGHSMGAMTALAVAANHPELVRAAILEDPPFRADFPFVLTLQEQQELQQAATEGLAFKALPLEVRMAQGRSDNPHWSEEEIVPWAAAKGEYRPEIVPHRVQFRSYHWRDALSRVTCPVLLITGDAEQGAIITRSIAQEAADCNQRCEIAQISSAGHSIHRDRYADTIEVALNFLRRN